jgi:hypothetical protein
MNIGVRLIDALPIQAAGPAYQATAVTFQVSTALDNTDTGGLLQSPVRGYMDCTTTTRAYTVTALAVQTTAFLLAASGLIFNNTSAYQTLFPSHLHDQRIPGSSPRGGALIANVHIFLTDEL